MFERFTDRARKIMGLANQEAIRLHNEYIGTEHILLGLIAEGNGVGAAVLKTLNVDLRKLAIEVEKMIDKGPDMLIMGKLTQTPRSKKVIELAIEESRRLGHNYVGSEHLLLGLIREPEGVAGTVLRNMGSQIEQARNEVLEVLGIDERPLFVGSVNYSTPEAQQAADLAGQSAKDMGHLALCTGHLLLGLLEEREGMAARLLAKLGVTGDTVRKEVVKCRGRETEG